MKVAIIPLHALQKDVKFYSIFALPQFLELMGDDIKDAFYLVISGDNTELLMPTILRRIPPGLSVAFSPAPAQVIRGSYGLIDWREVLNVSTYYLKKKYNCILFSMIQRPHDPKFIRGNLNGYIWSHNYDVMIDLSKKLHEIYYGMDKRHRYTLRRILRCSDNELLSSDWLQKTGFTIKEVDKEGERGLYEFRDLWITVRERMYKNFTLFKRALYRDPLELEHLVNVFNELRPHGLIKIFTAYDDNEQPGASAILFVSSNFTKIPVAYWSAGASSEKGKRNGLPSLLQWYVIQWLTEHGYHKYYMGGYDIRNPDSGPSLFKKGFGGKIVTGLTVVWTPPPLSIFRNITAHILSSLAV